MRWSEEEENMENLKSLWIDSEKKTKKNLRIKKKESR